MIELKKTHILANDILKIYTKFNIKRLSKLLKHLYMAVQVEPHDKCKDSF